MEIPEYIASQFHDAYESLAGEYGYYTRRDSAVPWDDVPLVNKNLMIAVVEKLLGDEVIAKGTALFIPTKLKRRLA